jgi:arginine deiminase
LDKKNVKKEKKSLEKSLKKEAKKVIKLKKLVSEKIESPKKTLFQRFWSYLVNGTPMHPSIHWSII